MLQAVLARLCLEQLKDHGVCCSLATSELTGQSTLAGNLSLFIRFQPTQFYADTSRVCGVHIRNLSTMQHNYE